MAIFSDDDAAVAPHERLKQVAAILALAVRRRLVVLRMTDSSAAVRELPFVVETLPKQRRRNFEPRYRSSERYAIFRIWSGGVMAVVSSTNRRKIRICVPRA